MDRPPHHAQQQPRILIPDYPLPGQSSSTTAACSSTAVDSSRKDSLSALVGDSHESYLEQRDDDKGRDKDKENEQPGLQFLDYGTGSNHSQGNTIRGKRDSMRGPDVGPLAQFEKEDRTTVEILGHALLATAIVRIWPSLCLLGAWATAICCINEYTTANLVVSNTLLTVLGTLNSHLPSILASCDWERIARGIRWFTVWSVGIDKVLHGVIGTILGLVLSYRTSSAYERYNEGRKLFSQIIIGSRTLGRIIWYHCPDYLSPPDPEKPMSEAEKKKEREITLREKRQAVELCLAFAVSVKHYLRGEDGVFYEDLYDLIKFLPLYHISPTGIPPPNLANDQQTVPEGSQWGNRKRISDTPPREDSSQSSLDSVLGRREPELDSRTFNGPSSIPFAQIPGRPKLRPARNPPKHSWTHFLSETVPLRYLPWAKVKRRRRRLQEMSYGYGGFEGDVDDQHSIPLEITLYMSAFVAELQKRKVVDVPTTNSMLAGINVFTDTLAHLERILTTPIPFSYQAHIYEVSWLYCLLLPFQIYQAFRWMTIPATIAVTYILLGLIECGQEIENPFGYDKNDLNLDYFCEHIIKKELMALTSKTPHPPATWVVPGSTSNIEGLPLLGPGRLPEKRFFALDVKHVA